MKVVRDDKQTQILHSSGVVPHRGSALARITVQGLGYRVWSFHFSCGLVGVWGLGLRV